MKNKILILGATGNVGSEVVKQLKKEQADFVVAAYSQQVEDVKNVKVDFDDTITLKNAMEGIDTLFMLIPANPNMIKWAQNILQIAKENNIHHIVRLSSAIAYNASKYNFMQQLLEIDSLVIKSGIAYTILLPQFFMQNLSSMLANDYKSGALYLPAGNGKIGWIDIRDIASVATTILLNPAKYIGEKILISGSEALSYDETIKIMNKVLGYKSKYIAIQSQEARKTMDEIEIPSYFIDLLIDLNSAIADDLANEINDNVQIITGKKPISLNQFIQDYKSYWL